MLVIFLRYLRFQGTLRHLKVPQHPLVEIDLRYLKVPQGTLAIYRQNMELLRNSNMFLDRLEKITKLNDFFSIIVFQMER